MALSTIALALAAVGMLGTLYLAVIFQRNPATALERVHHLPEQLPKVMTGRYIGNFVLALGALLYGDMLVITVLYAVFALESVYDVVIYRKVGKPFGPHMQGAVLSDLVCLVALVAYVQGGA